MTAPSVLDTPSGRRIAYHRTPGAGPGVVFFGGFRSDMEGTKAVHLEAWAKRTGRAVPPLRLLGPRPVVGAVRGRRHRRLGGGCGRGDHRAHGRTADPRRLLDGGWISLLVARRLTARVAGLVGIAAAPDFTAAMEAEFTESDRRSLAERGLSSAPRTTRLRLHLHPPPLRGRTEEPCARRTPAPAVPVRLLQGTADTDVEPAVALRL